MHCLRDWFHVICISFLLQLRLYFLASIILQQIFSTQQPQVLDSMLLFSVRRNWPLWNTSEGRPWGMRILRSAAPQIPWPLGVGVAGGRSDLSRRIGHQPKWNRNHPTAFVLVPADTSGQCIRYLSSNASLVIPWVIKTERMKKYVCSVPKSFFFSLLRAFLRRLADGWHLGEEETVLWYLRRIWRSVFLRQPFPNNRRYPENGIWVPGWDKIYSGGWCLK